MGGDHVDDHGSQYLIKLVRPSADFLGKRSHGLFRAEPEGQRREEEEDGKNASNPDIFPPKVRLAQWSARPTGWKRLTFRSEFGELLRLAEQHRR